MQKILIRRALRDLKVNIFRYLALSLLILFCVYLIVSLIAAADTVIVGGRDLAKTQHLEDGQFSVFTPLTKAQEEQLKDTGVTVEAMFYMDIEGSANKETLRLFKNRECLDLIALDVGRLAETDGEVVLEKRYCQENNLAPGDDISLDGEKLHIVGIGTVPDYDAMFKNLSDSSVDSKNFGLAFVCDGQYESFKARNAGYRSESYTYAYSLGDTIREKELKDLLSSYKFTPRSVKNLIQFLPASDNPRIGASANDQVINRMAGYIAGVIVLILFSYVISVFIIHNIEAESSEIGALYALGVRRRELIVHYLTLPVIITFISGILGTVAGFSPLGLNWQLRSCYGYFSIPELPLVYSPSVLVYGLLMPPVVAVVVNTIVMNKRLSRPALALIRKEPKESRGRNISLGRLGFISRFRIRQMLRETRSTGAVLLGMFIALLVMMIGVDCYVLCVHIRDQNKADTKFEYMYTCKYPQPQVPEGGEAAYAVALQKENLGYTMDVTLLGIDRDNPYFDVNVEPGENKAALSSAAAQKFGVKKGDTLVLTDGENDRGYEFTVTDIVQYSTSLYAFMDIKSMRQLFSQEEDYYNVVFSHKALDILPDHLLAVTSRADIEKASDVFISMMMPMISMLILVSAVVFFVVMYLMMKVMIDRSAFGISLIKVFGFRDKEVKKLYLNGNFYVIAVGAAICLPLSKIVMDRVFPVMVANVSCGLDLSFSWQLFLGIYGAILLLYLLINRMLVGKVKRVTPAEVLKNRE